MSLSDSVARPRLGRIVDGDSAGRVAIDPRAHRPARAANDNGLTQVHRRFDRLWPLVVVALLILVWAVLSVFS
jgi:hypothetical protein